MELSDPERLPERPQSRFGTITVAVGLLSLRLKYQILVLQTRGRPASAGVNFRDVVTGSLRQRRSWRCTICGE